MILGRNENKLHFKCSLIGAIASKVLIAKNYQSFRCKNSKSIISRFNKRDLLSLWAFKSNIWFIKTYFISTRLNCTTAKKTP